HRDFRPLALSEAGEADVVVVIGREAVVLERRLGGAFEIVAEIELVDLPHARAWHGIDPSHEGADFPVRFLAYAKRGRVAGIDGDVLRLRRAEPGVIGRPRLEVARRPDP